MSDELVSSGDAPVSEARFTKVSTKKGKSLFKREFTLFTFVHGYFHKLVADLDDASLADQPIAGVNHAAWNIGHLAIANDYISKILRNDGVCPPEYGELFAPGSKPRADRAAYPSKDELVKMFDMSYNRAAFVVGESSEEQLATPQLGPFFKDELPLVGDLIAHLMTTHAAMHLGQISLWRRAMGLPSVLGL